MHSPTFCYSFFTLTLFQLSVNGICNVTSSNGVDTAACPDGETCSSETVLLSNGVDDYNAQFCQDPNNRFASVNVLGKFFG